MGQVVPLPVPDLTCEDRPVLVLDLGGQYAQLIARRVRDARVYSELVPHTLSAVEARRRNPRALILSGGPASVYSEGAPRIDEELYRRIVEEIGPEPLAGSLLHLCVRRPEGGLRYLDVWASEQDCARAFDERIHPAVAGSAAVASRIQGRKGSQIRSTSALDKPVTSARRMAASPPPTRSQAALSRNLDRATAATGPMMRAKAARLLTTKNS